MKHLTEFYDVEGRRIEFETPMALRFSIRAYLIDMNEPYLAERQEACRQPGGDK